MRLKEEEIKKIDESLAILEKSLLEEMQNFPNAESRSIDNANMEKIASSYLSAKGVMMLVADSRLQSTESNSNCLCGCSCAEPSHGIVTW